LLVAKILVTPSTVAISEIVANRIRLRNVSEEGSVDRGILALSTAGISRDAPSFPTETSALVVAEQNSAFAELF
jgi:hypothetical protein